MKPSNQLRGWGAATAGAAGALVLLVLLLCNAGPLVLGDVDEPPGRTSRPSAERARRAVMVVIDAVRGDAARDPKVMPNFVALARAGGSATAVIDSLLPSTVAGIQSLATGRSPPPLSIFEDFGASGSKHGGVFAALKKNGKRAFVVGPHLWVDLYGPWIDGSITVKTIGSDDKMLLSRTLEVLKRRDWDVLVVHLGMCDEAAHRYGGISIRYRDCLRWSDGALGRILAGLPPATGVVVTTDHGVTTTGGHVGPEHAVVHTPVATRGPGMPTGQLGEIRQTDVPALLLGALGLPREALAHAEPASRMPRGVAAVLVIGLIALGCAIRLWSALGVGLAARSHALVLLAALGAVILLAGNGRYLVAAIVAAVSLAATAFWAGGGGWSWIAAALVVGVGFGGLRLLDGWTAAAREGPSETTMAGLLGPGIAIGGLVVLQGVAVSLWGRRRRFGRVLVLWLAYWTRLRWILSTVALVASGWLLGGWPLSAMTLGALIVGGLLGERLRGSGGRAFVIGATFVLASVALSRALGENVSLSTTDVRAAYGLVDGALGIAAAGFVYALRMALLTFALLIGAGPWLCSAPRKVLSRFAAGSAAALVGEALLPAVLLASESAGYVSSSLSVSALLRSCGELAFYFAGLALTLLLARPRARVAVPPSAEVSRLTEGARTPSLGNR